MRMMATAFQKTAADCNVRRKEGGLAFRSDDPDELESAVLACAKGDQSGLRLIFDRESGRLVAVAQRIVRRRELAEEVVQDAFIRIWTHAHQYSRERGSARGWIYAIVRNRALNMLRDGGREEAVDDIEALQDRDHANEVMAAWQMLDRDSRLRECLDGLEETRRSSILMAYVGGYTHGEIAGRLRIPLGTTKSWIRRGLSALRECLS
ncbi:sigma-70 family RNA polymerase sigma factor [Shinella sp.]|uniref:sigma-70 family RNA polymerase sigma factor n=1 Tax=Shinella sp. TaxID=1870904 RepID=UPI0029BA7DB8|nr:sigma-70 family RNA polymerase sigma factor [Shinella sp.]MDX3977691.1 sigma-70 family RNA polymerase sigma factor [Shinella sp.]